MNSAPKVFALVDCNSFYCSCERLFRPDLIGKPVGVLSNNDGCIVSGSRELKALGVKVGEPYFKVKAICDVNKAAIFSANFAFYTNMSDRVMQTLAQFAPAMEIYSVDEAFLDLTGIPKAKLNDLVRTIKQVVEKNTGIPVSIGVAPTKTLAKLANFIAKKKDKHQGILSLLDTNEDFLAQVKVEDIWGVGRQKAGGMRALNIKSARDLRDYPNDALIQKLFSKVTRMTQDELRGIPCLTLNSVVTKKQEIISSRSFGSPVFDLKSLRESVANYASLASETLRKQDSVCAAVEVYIRTSQHNETTHYSAYDSISIPAQTSDTRKIIKYAWAVLDKLYKEGYDYKKAQVKLSGIRDKDQVQLNLFEAGDSSASDKLNAVMDKINAREGKLMIKSAACGVDNQAWKSPRYVTGWSELPKV